MTRVWLSLSIALLAAACATTTSERLGLDPPRTVSHVDLERYLGTWYEIASFPQRFQEGCTATTATYSRRGDGEIDVVNRCRKGTPEGPEDSATGRARVVDATSNAKLEVTFFWPFWGDYWVIGLGDDYDYAVVGSPSRDYLWILAREPVMAPDRYDAIVAEVKAQGFEVERLRRTVQPTR